MSHSDQNETFTETERLLLMAAAVRGFGPSRDLSRANTVRVVQQALVWLGVSWEEIEGGLLRLERQDPDENRLSDRVNSVYEVLIRMTRVGSRPPKRPGPALFEGGGNWGVPSDPSRPASSPYFNSCRLTADGERLALQLLEQHHEYRRNAL
jgi:hypothetical protein